MLRMWEDCTIKGKVTREAPVGRVGCQILTSGAEKPDAGEYKMIAWRNPPPGIVSLIETFIGELIHLCLESLGIVSRGCSPD